MELVGFVGFRDKLKKGAKQFISNLKESKIPSWILTGDNFTSSQSTAVNLRLINLQID